LKLGSKSTPLLVQSAKIFAPLFGALWIFPVSPFATCQIKRSLDSISPSLITPSPLTGSSVTVRPLFFSFAVIAKTF